MLVLVEKIKTGIAYGDVADMVLFKVLACIWSCKFSMFVVQDWQRLSFFVANLSITSVVLSSNILQTLHSLPVSAS